LAATDAFVQDHYLPVSPGVTLGAFDTASQLVACAAVQPAHTMQQYRTNIVGQVHPRYRRQGLGTYLLRWSVVQARRLLDACPADRPHLLSLRTEGLTPTAAQLYAQHGFTLQFTEDVMRRPLDRTLPTTPLPPGIVLVPWTPQAAPQFFDVYQAAFQERLGYPGWSAEQWIAWITEDEDFCSQRSLLACADELPVGFIVSSDTWIVQVGVRPEWRARGVGSALVGEVLQRVHAVGGAEVLLTVNVNNPSATRVYRQLGFGSIGQRARYEQKLP
jgi:ribosomal protein S18 acetylase RimI-like enzyme